MRAIALFFIFIAFLTGCTEKKPEFRSIDITGAEYALDFALPDTRGQTTTLADFKGKAVVLFSTVYTSFWLFFLIALDVFFPVRR